MLRYISSNHIDRVTRDVSITFAKKNYPYERNRIIRRDMIFHTLSAPQRYNVIRLLLQFPLVQRYLQNLLNFRHLISNILLFSSPNSAGNSYMLIIQRIDEFYKQVINLSCHIQKMSDIAESISYHTRDQRCIVSVTQELDWLGSCFVTNKDVSSPSLSKQTMVN